MILEGKRAAFITLGCKLNFSETSTIKQSLEEVGVITVNEKEGAEIFIINTCSVTDVAERKGRQAIKKIINRNPGAYVIVVGCYAQLRAKEIMQIEGVSLVLGANDKFRVDHYLSHLEENNEKEPHSCDIFKLSEFDLAYSFGDRTRCFLKVQDGCDYFCSYCTIPYARGKSRSASIEEVVNAVNNVVRKGVKEVILTGVNTGDFGRGTSTTFMDLIKTLEKVEGIERFRISSIEPNLLTQEIIEFVANSNKFMPHFHIPLQSGSNTVLQLMKRRYNRELFKEKIEIIRELIPEGFIGVDIIVGMRGETEELFNESKDFIETLNISQLHVFPYSERQGTKALDIAYTVNPKEKQRRVNTMLEISEKKHEEFCRQFMETTRKVLFEESKVNGKMYGFTDNYIKVSAPFNESMTNQIVEVKLKEESIEF